MMRKCVELILECYPEVQAIYLFGSWGTEHRRPDSDVDLALLLPFDVAEAEKGRLAMGPCQSALSEMFGAPVDLINLRLVSVVFQHEIVTSGRRIYEADIRAVHEFEMLVLSFYQKLNEERSGILEEIYRTGRVYNV